MKKLLSVMLAVLLLVSACFAFASCANNNDPANGSDGSKESGSGSNGNTPTPSADFKLGVILLHDENSTYDLNFINGVKAAAEALGLKENQVIYKRNIPESNVCYETALDLVDEGCKVIFADSFGHESHILKAAKENPDVQFCHATGTQAATANLKNFHNAFASIYEGRYLAGVAAGLKLNEMIESGKITADQAKMGYVGAFTYAEVISGYTSFYLGAKSVCPSVTMEVQFTGSWYDEATEKSTALSLINNGCVLISQHADSMGAPTACEDKKVPNVSYNGSTKEHCPNTFIVSSRIDWAPYLKYICEQTMNGKEIDTNWTGTIGTDSVVLTDVNETAAAAGTAEKLAEVKKGLLDGTIKVFDTKTFTVTVVKEGDSKLNANATVDAEGHLTAYLADVDGDYVGDTDVIVDGAFAESKFRSAPYFDVQIDGIKLLNVNFGD